MNEARVVVVRLPNPAGDVVQCTRAAGDPRSRGGSCGRAGRPPRAARGLPDRDDVLPVRATRTAFAHRRACRAGGRRAPRSSSMPVSRAAAARASGAGEKCRRRRAEASAADGALPAAARRAPDAQHASRSPRSWAASTTGPFPRGWSSLPAGARAAGSGAGRRGRALLAVSPGAAFGPSKAHRRGSWPTPSRACARPRAAAARPVRVGERWRPNRRAPATLSTDREPARWPETKAARALLAPADARRRLRHVAAKPRPSSRSRAHRPGGRPTTRRFGGLRLACHEKVPDQGHLCMEIAFRRPSLKPASPPSAVRL